MTNDPVTTAAARKVDAVIWGLLLIWIGVALFANLGWGMGLLGVGILLLGDQVAKKVVGGGIEPFWIAVGAVFVIGGVAELLSSHVNLIPIVCIVAGVTLLVSALARRQTV